MSFKKIGDYIELTSRKNKDLSVKNLLGINISNCFMPTVANKNGLDLSKYKIVEKGVFATNIMHVGRDERLPIALYESEKPALVSPAYKTFRVKDENKLIPEYLMIEFQRPEFHRLAWYFCDSSVRGGLDWERFCEIKIPVPDIKIQRRYVSVYNSLIKNQKSYEESLDDLQDVCIYYMNSLTNDKKLPIGDLVDLVDLRNAKGKVSKLLGINVKKEFMPSKAKTTKENLTKYKVINEGQFAYSAMQVGRDETVRVVLYEDNEPAIISPAYSIFQVKDQSDILPEFLMLWFYRPEFNRYGWFISDSSVRASLEWSRFCEIEVPVPSMEIQEAIVSVFNALQERKRINEELKNQIKPICPVLMKGVVENELEPEAQ